MIPLTNSLPAPTLADRLARLQPALAHAAPRHHYFSDGAVAADATPDPLTQPDPASGDPSLLANFDATARANRAAALTLLRDPAEAAAATTQLVQQLKVQRATALVSHAPLAATQALPLLTPA